MGAFESTERNHTQFATHFYKVVSMVHYTQHYLPSELVHYLLLLKYNIPKIGSVSVHRTGQKPSQVATPPPPPPPKQKNTAIFMTQLDQLKYKAVMFLTRMGSKHISGTMKYLI
jgi:hypothetical protein